VLSHIFPRATSLAVRCDLDNSKVVAQMWDSELNDI